MADGDVRAMMRGKLAAAAGKRISHPLAKYNATDHLICVVCNSVIKSNNLWQPHILSKPHKENVELFKAQQKLAAQKQAAAAAAAQKQQAAAEKAAAAQAGSLVSYGDDSDESEGEAGPEQPPSQPAPAPEANRPNKRKNTGSSLPEGFFDDARQDAKARKVEFKPKGADELDRFQKEIEAEEQIAEAIVEDDLEESAMERERIEHFEQKAMMDRLAALKQKKQLFEKEKSSTKAASKPKAEANGGGGDDEDDDDDEDFDDGTSGWRTKGI